MANVKKGVRGFITKPIEERFVEKVDKSGGIDACWIWLGATDGRYGMIWFNGRNVRATRISWELFHGKPFPDGMDACHTCDNPRCVNPLHIWPGTPSENALDAVRKGRLDPSKNKPSKKKTHCKRGHEFTPENTYQSTKGRGCVMCRKIYHAEQWAAERQARVSAGEKMYSRPDSRGEYVMTLENSK